MTNVPGRLRHSVSSIADDTSARLATQILLSRTYKQKLVFPCILTNRRITRQKVPKAELSYVMRDAGPTDLCWHFG